MEWDEAETLFTAPLLWEQVGQGTTNVNPVSLGKGRTQKITSKKAGKCEILKTGYAIQGVAGAQPSPGF